MARPASVEVAGYYPSPTSVLPRIASLVSWPEGSAHGVLLDPCAGDGGAITALRDAWSPPTGSTLHAGPKIVACELEAERAKRLRAALPHHHHDQALAGDAFRLLPTADLAAGGGATVLYLNPPYDHDAEFQRLEHRFLVRFTGHLAAGAGFLLFLVPFRALPASADYLAVHYADLRCYRLPDPEFQAFGQVVLAGRRRRRPIEAASAARILEWASHPRELPLLPERAPDPFEVPRTGSVWYRLEYRLAEADVESAVAAFRPWTDGETGGRLAAHDLLGSRFPVALPPKPAHIALALAAGMFNGHRLEPDDPDRFPPVLAKGAYSREPVEIERRVSDDGTESVTAIDRPRLTVTVLRLDDSTFHTLVEGTEPAGGEDLEHWTAADLLLHYGRSMAELLGRQFPPLHDPADPDGRVALPDLPRTPYRVQDDAVQAALKLLATGRNPFLTAEVGTGKTTMALYVAAALSPAHHASTVSRLRELGHDRPLPVVCRTLVLCPPHLLESWRDQAAAVVPDARVQIVQDAPDLEADADLFVLSRERAKLGHGHDGIEGVCPRCGTAIETSASSNASRRRRCEAVVRRPANLEARLAGELAALLAPACPNDDLVATLAPPRLLEHVADRAPAPVSAQALERFRDRVLGTLPTVLSHPTGLNPMGRLYLLLRLLRALTPIEDSSREELARRLEELVSITDAEASRLTLQREAEDLARPGSTTAAAGDAPDAKLRGLLEQLDESADWHITGPCDEPLYQAVPPRRLPLSRVILRSHRRRFDLVVLDEAHEFNNRQSAQAKAAHRLAGIPGAPTLVLTGSLMGGYASSLFANVHALSPAFRAEFSRDDVGEFVARYGYRKVRITLRDPAGGGKWGRHSDRELVSRRVIGEAPGVHPLFLMRYLLETAIPVHKEDLDHALPPLTEEPVPLYAPEGDRQARELLGEYRRLQDELVETIRRDRSDPERAGRLLGALVQLPSYLDRATDDLERYAVRYPESVGGTVIATGASFPASWRTPKEAWLLEEISRRIDAGERVLLFLGHTQSRLPHRILRLVQEVAPGAVWLDARKVPTAKRERWIDRHVNEPMAPVLVVNPNAVRTGLNNLVGFSTGIWHELDASAFCYRQTIGRLHRIGQTRPVSILLPYYAGTAQEVLFQLVAKKISASLQVDGLDVRAALEAAGAGGGLPDGLDAALSLGKAVYRRLSRAA
jgi:hypothetical protein